MISQLFKSKSFLLFVSIGILSSLLWILDSYTLELLKYDADGVSNGQIWRLISGHFVHSNGWHLLLNLASLLMIGVLFSEHLSAWMWALVFGFSAIVVSVCYLWLAPEFNSYVGLSAVLYGIIIIGALLDLQQQPKIALLVLVVVTGRVMWQQYSGSVESLGELIEARVAIESHLFGICAGYGQGLLLVWRQRWLHKNANHSTDSARNSLT